MIFNLNKSVEIKNLAEIYLSGKNLNSKKHRVKFIFSKEALIGFAINLAWTYTELSINRRFHFHIDPLGANISGNQPLGFFLTSNSPSLVIQLDNIECDFDNKISYDCKEINIRKGALKKYEVKEPASEESLEEYEIGFRNIACIKIYDDFNKDVTRECSQVVFKLTYEGLKDIANMLLILADNYKENIEYLLAHLKQKKLQYNMGVIFTKKSHEVVFSCQDLGCAYDYDFRFGTIK